MSYNPNNPNGQATMANSAPVAIASDQSNLPTNITQVAGSAVSLGQKTSANSIPMVIASDQSSLNAVLPDSYTAGASAQTATVNNILTNPSGSAATDALNYHSAVVQVVSTGTGGTFIFEGSNDNVNFNTLVVYNSALTTGVPILAAITASASSTSYTFSLSHRYIRLRIATTITGGSIQAFSKLSQAAFAPPAFQVANNTAANLATTATIASGTVTTVSTVTTVGSVTSSNTAIPGSVTDVASAAITTTTTTGTLTPTFGSCYQVNIPVTAATGTTPTMDVEVQESADGGTNWYAVYDFPRITATGSYNSPVLNLTGNRVRYVQTIGGTTPSFTRAINRLQASSQNVPPYRQIVDRTVSLTTLNSTTVSLFGQNIKNAQLVINIGAATTPPSLQLQGSDDAGATWYNIGTPLAAVASSTVQTTVANMTSQFLRAIVTSAGTGVTAGYVLVRGF